MNIDFKNILIIADIEGSSGCWSYEASQFKTLAWAQACREMTLDIAEVVTALFDAGVNRIMVKDFHRTAYNLLPGIIDSRARVLQGYRTGPVPGIGKIGPADAVMFIGMHAASGSNGFLAHTLTSRISRLSVNDRLMPELEFFAASLAPLGLRPVFFSGCPVACEQAQLAIPGISTFAIDKSNGPGSFDNTAWRAGLSQAAAQALKNKQTLPYNPPGPFNARVTMREGKDEASKIAERWGLEYQDDTIFIGSEDINELYLTMINICYLTPFTKKIAPLALPLFNLLGRQGLSWVLKHQ